MPSPSAIDHSNHNRDIARPVGTVIHSAAANPDSSGAATPQHRTKRSTSGSCVMSGTRFCQRNTSQHPPAASAQLIAASRMLPGS